MKGGSTEGNVCTPSFRLYLISQLSCLILLPWPQHPRFPAEATLWTLHGPYGLTSRWESQPHIHQIPFVFAASGLLSVLFYQLFLTIFVGVSFKNGRRCWLRRKFAQIGHFQDFGRVLGCVYTSAARRRVAEGFKLSCFSRGYPSPAFL